MGDHEKLSLEVLGYETKTHPESRQVQRKRLRFPLSGIIM